MKKLNLFLVILLTSITSVFAQGNKVAAQNPVDTDEPVDYTKVKIKPEFRGETWAFYLSHNMKYPEAAVKSKITGKVYVSFIIEKNGAITNVTLVEGLGYGLDEEAVRLIKNSPRWKPGYQVKKVPVRVSCIMPIAFTPS